MDIQRKEHPKAQKVNFTSAPKDPILPEFVSHTPPVTPRGPYILGEEQLWTPNPSPNSFRKEVREYEPIVQSQILKPSLPARKKRNFRIPLKNPKLLWMIPSIILFFLITYGILIYSSLKKDVEQGFTATKKGINYLGEKNFQSARISFETANQHFESARVKTLYFPVWMAKPLTKVPGLAKVGTGVLGVEASVHLTDAALQTTTIIESATIKENGNSVSYLQLLRDLEEPLEELGATLKKAESSISAIPLKHIPEDQQLIFDLLQKAIPGLATGIDSLLTNTPLVEELLGKNGPRIYLFLFQNNQELRPTGGFIGTYGILEFKDGHARRFFIDGIFNPDGQLKENIVPPKAVQKISGGWSLHDSNWFPDFPTSAEKAIFFYEKTGGPTVDGVFTLTPTVMERLLEVTGPIELPEYEMVVGSKNFIPTIQEQVEVKYDRVENKPKKVLGDLASILMEKVFNTTDPFVLYALADIFVEGMNEKHILLYTRNDETQALIEKTGWSGKIEESTHDYLSVIHTNINGFKTDGVIEDSIDHDVTIETDGTLTAKTTVIRKHQGGNTPYDWWNSVNSDYMRVYVPKGSKLIRATGHTKEFPPAPLDYDALGFRVDEDLKKEEESIQIDETSGTRIGEEFGKTVFGNWVYVSPGEEVRVEYTYTLPFALDPTQAGERSYSLLFQKQAGQEEVTLRSRVEFPKKWKIEWQSDDELLRTGESGIQLERSLRTDAFWGVVFRK